MNICLKAIREEQNLTQAAVAKRAGISQPTYSNIENGQRNPSVCVAKRIGDVLGIEWTELFETEQKEAGA